MKVKIFESSTTGTLEREINEWLGTTNYLEIKDIKYSMSIDSSTHRRWSQAIILYEEVVR